MTDQEFPKSYNPSGIEEHWYSEWERGRCFHVDASDARKPFTIVIPPPNVTGALHMGHALDETLQDILIRYKRMDGYASLWIPGTDHAGIATQNVVEKELGKEKLTRHQVGREKFVTRVWEWKEKYGNHILRQLKRLGCSCDWERERFTMDPVLSRAVRTVFVSLYNEGLIYRSSYLISACPRCRTALSDLEVEYHEIDGQLTYFHYETEDGRRISMATTRPETMLGDTAVAVHPDDPRYRDWVGATLVHPFVDRRFPVIGDVSVKKEFGTGAVKVTPAHDPNDYALGKQHNLEFITILDETAKMTNEAGPYSGMDRFEARKRVVADLKAKGLFEKAEPHRHAVGHCQRCGTIVEPRISEQWFVKIAPLARPAAEAVRSGRTKFVPESWTKTYLDWMENIRDWCISRQLWWGHRIPVWYCSDCRKETVALDDPHECVHCGSAKIEQDPDVLDTWFSSSLWPFSTMGWPDKTPELAKFYPTTVLVTGFDIIFFWVARMMMMGLKFMNDVPFGTVHIHALVRDEQGKKMSKSKGNVVDPLELMEKYGTDSFRFALTSFAVQGRDILLSEKRIEGYRNFITKLWNASRFALTFLGETAIVPETAPSTLPDRWIRNGLNELTGQVRTAFDEMRFSDAADAIYHFTWHEFCDWYIEMVKPHQAASRETILYVLDRLLRLMHPITPFVTEEIWQRLPIPRTTSTIMLAPYPSDDRYRDAEAVREVIVLQEVISGIRNIRSEHKVAPSRKIEVQLATVPGRARAALDLVAKHRRYVEALAGVERLALDPPKKPKNAALALCGDLEVYVPLEGLIDVASEQARLQKERQKAAEDEQFLASRLADPSYRAKAPPQLIAKDEEKLRDVRSRLEKLDHSLAILTR
ncbi:MAG: valine--tRNA ligase [Pseudomonadota bacterium]